MSGEWTLLHGFLDGTDGMVHLVEDLPEVREEGVHLFCDYCTVGRWLYQAILLQDPQRIPDLVLWELELLGQSDDANGLGLLYGPQHEYVSLEKMELPPELVGQNAPLDSLSLGHSNSSIMPPAQRVCPMGPIIMSNDDMPRDNISDT